MSLQFITRRNRKAGTADATAHLRTVDPAEAVRRNVDKAQRQTPLALPF